MSSNLRIIHIRDFMKFTPMGVLDLGQVKRVIHDFGSTAGGFAEHDLLVDTRGADVHLSVIDLWTIAKELADVVHAGEAKGFWAKISVLCPLQGFDQAKFLELCSQNHGLNVRAFTSYEDVFEWLGESSAHS